MLCGVAQRPQAAVGQPSMGAALQSLGLITGRQREPPVNVALFARDQGWTSPRRIA
jgi:hypothetical protein